MPRIQANRDTIDDRFSVLGFTVRSESPLFEVAIATDPNLFKPENRGRRAHANFYSSRAQGVTRARRGEAVYLVPPDVLTNFLGQPRLYFGLATYRENSRGRPDYVQAPTDGSMYVSTSQLTERGLRRALSMQIPTSYGRNNGRDSSLDWGGDAVVVAQAPAAGKAGNGSAGPPKMEPPVAASAGYDDGFGVFPESLERDDEAAKSAADDGIATAQEVLLKPYDGSLASQIQLFAETAAWIAGVPDTKQLPHSAICHLLIYNGDTLKGRATGFYVGRNVLMTNAHVVKGFTKLVVIPGKNGAGTDAAHEPFGRFTVNLTAATSRPHPKYNGGRDFDLAIVKVPTAAPNGAWLSPIEELTQSRPEGVAVCGYSAHSRRGDLVATIVHATLDPERQHVHRGFVRSITDDSFAYDVQELAGSSGSPVYWIEQGLRTRVHVVGINAGPKDDIVNEGCRLTAAKVKWIRDIATEWGQPIALEVDEEAHADALAVPLDPGVGGRSIGVSTLQAGDIILSTTRHYQSRIIRLGTFSPVSHTMLYVGDGKVIEAVGSGVREVTLAAAIDDAILAVAYRHPRLDAAHAAAIVAHARSRVGNPYNYAGVVFQGYRIVNPVPTGVIQAIGKKLGVEVGQAGAVYCSELVLEAFERAGLALSSGTRPAQSTPDQVVQIARGNLSYVGHLKAEDVPLGIQLGMSDALETELATALATGTTPKVRVRDKLRRPARFPAVRMLSKTESTVVTAMFAPLNPPVAAMVTALRALTAAHNVCVAVGPAVGVGFLIGMGAGAGVIFAPGGQIGVYGQFDLRGGLIDSASAELQVTIVQGGIETFSGINFAVGVEFDAVVSVSGQALFNTSAQFQGITVGLGAGLGVEPFQCYLAMQAGASQALALCNEEPASAMESIALESEALASAPKEDALPPAPAPVIQQPLEAGAVAEAQAAPAVIPIVAAVVGAVFTRVLSNSGDVSWELDQMSGLKHPDDVASSPMPAFQDAKPIQLTDWPSSGRGDKISAGFEIRWQYNGRSLGNVQILNVAANDAIGWGLVVKARIMNDSIVYPRNNPQFAALRVRFEYRFTRALFSDQLAYRELHLFANGAVNMTGDWTQNSVF